MEKLQNSARALCLTIFPSRKKLSKFHFSCQLFRTFGGPGKVFATRPPPRSGFGNNAKQCAGAMFGIFFGSEKNIVFSLFPFGDPGKVFATRPPQRSGFGNNAKQCAGAMFGIFFGSEKISYFHLFRLGTPARSSQHVHLREADLEIMQNSAQALCLAFFLGRKNSRICTFSVKLSLPLGTLALARCLQHLHLREFDLATTAKTVHDE